MNEKHIIEKISFYKLWLTLLVTIDAGTTAWFFNNAQKIGLLKIIIAVFTIFLISGIVIILNWKARKMIKKLEEQK